MVMSCNDERSTSIHLWTLLEVALNTSIQYHSRITSLLVRDELDHNIVVFAAADERTLAKRPRLSPQKTLFSC